MNAYRLNLLFAFVVLGCGVDIPNGVFSCGQIGDCPPGFECWNDGFCYDALEPGCEPQSCEKALATLAPFGVECGQELPDGCDGFIDCSGVCIESEICGAGGFSCCVLGTPECDNPCIDVGAECGFVDGVLCGACAPRIEECNEDNQCVCAADEFEPNNDKDTSSALPCVQCSISKTWRAGLEKVTTHVAGDDDWYRLRVRHADNWISARIGDGEQSELELVYECPNGESGITSCVDLKGFSGSEQGCVTTDSFLAIRRKCNDDADTAELASLYVRVSGGLASSCGYSVSASATALVPSEIVDLNF